MTSLLSRAVLDDLSIRFIISRPEFVVLNPEEYFFLVEEAHWFALDFLKIQNISLPIFAQQLLNHNGIEVNIDADYLHFKTYKQSIKVFGTMIFSRDFTHCLLVQQSGSSKSITFPKGKKSMNETGKECAIRETLEEVGYDVSNKIIDISVTVFDKITFYFVLNVDMQTKFKTFTRNEIERIFWFDLSKANAVKNRKEFKIFSTAYGLAEKTIEYLKKISFRFNMDRIELALERALEEQKRN